MVRGNAAGRCRGADTGTAADVPLKETAMSNSFVKNAATRDDEARIFSILQNLDRSLAEPTWPVGQVVELTGLSRARVRYLSEKGVFVRSSGGLTCQSVYQYFSSRLSRLARERKSFL